MRRASLLFAVAVPLTLSTIGCGDDDGSGGAPTTSSATSTPSSSATETSASTTSTTMSASTSSSSSTSTGSGVDCDPALGAPEPIQLVPFLTGIDKPIVLTPHPTDPTRMFVGTREGVVYVVENGTLVSEPFLDVSEEVSCCTDDRGFFGLAFHPSYDETGLFYVHYTRLGTVADSTTVLAEYQVSDNPDVADPTPVREIMTLDQTEVWHYGGSLAFGPDGLLYYPRGDGGGTGDPEDDAQNPMNRYGKILRIDVDTFPTPPPGNLPNADPFVYGIGLRNPWRSSFDRCTGDFYVADVGQNQIEEVSVQRAGEAHLNFGWNQYEGTSCYAPPCDPAGKTMPVVEEQHGDGWCAIVGGHVYRGSLLPGHRGRYFYGDICSKRIESFLLDETGVAIDPMDHSLDLQTLNLLGDQGFGSFGEDLNGELYVLDMTGGTVFRIEPD